MSVTAIKGAVPGALTTMDPVSPGSTRALDAWLTAFINTLATEQEAEVALILDDYHLIDTRAVHDTIQFLLNHLPSGLHVVLASRACR